jgi:hypothetical protein
MGRGWWQPTSNPALKTTKEDIARFPRMIWAVLKKTTIPPVLPLQRHMATSDGMAPPPAAQSHFVSDTYPEDPPG